MPIYDLLTNLYDRWYNICYTDISKALTETCLAECSPKESPRQLKIGRRAAGAGSFPSLPPKACKASSTARCSPLYEVAFFGDAWQDAVKRRSHLRTQAEW